MLRELSAIRKAVSQLLEVMAHPECIAPAGAGVSPELGKASFWEKDSLPTEPLQEVFQQLWSGLCLPSPELGTLGKGNSGCPGRSLPRSSLTHRFGKTLRRYLPGLEDK